MRIARAAKKLALVFLALLLTQIPAAASVQEKPGPVLLTVYLYDKCGGCGVNSPGCGDCKDIVKYHGIIKKQLGDRLYDGTITYRMLNCRLLVYNDACSERAKLYGAPEDIQNVRPLTFIGAEDSGLYLPGTALLPYVGEMLDRYIAGEDIGNIQKDIVGIYNLSKDAVAS
jgi:hypothetical protein